MPLIQLIIQTIINTSKYLRLMILTGTMTVSPYIIYYFSTAPTCSIYDYIYVDKFVLSTLFPGRELFFAHNFKFSAGTNIS